MHAASKVKYYTVQNMCSWWSLLILSDQMFDDNGGGGGDDDDDNNNNDDDGLLLLMIDGIYFIVTYRLLTYIFTYTGSVPGKSVISATIHPWALTCCMSPTAVQTMWTARESKAMETVRLPQENPVTMAMQTVPNQTMPAAVLTPVIPATNYSAMHTEKSQKSPLTSKVSRQNPVYIMNNLLSSHMVPVFMGLHAMKMQLTCGKSSRWRRYIMIIRRP